MIDASMLLHMISALDTLEKLIPAEEAGEYAVKKREWKSLKKLAGPNIGPRRGAGTGEWECERLHVTEGECLPEAIPSPLAPSPPSRRTFGVRSPALV